MNEELLKKFIERKQKEPNVVMKDSVIGWLAEFAMWLDNEAAQQSVQRTAGGLCPNCHEPKAAHVGAHRLCPNGEWNNYGRDTRRR
jgi:hypothetical protein